MSLGKEREENSWLCYQQPTQDSKIKVALCWIHKIIKVETLLDYLLTLAVDSWPWERHQIWRGRITGRTGGKRCKGSKRPLRLHLSSTIKRTPTNHCQLWAFLQPLLTLGIRNLTLHTPALNPGSWLHLLRHRRCPTWAGLLWTASAQMSAPVQGHFSDLTA